MTQVHQEHAKGGERKTAAVQADRGHTQQASSTAVDYHWPLALLPASSRAIISFEAGPWETQAPLSTLRVAGVFVPAAGSAEAHTMELPTWVVLLARPLSQCLLPIAVVQPGVPAKQRAS